MSKINRHPVRRTAAGVLAGALALSGAVAAGTPAFAATGFALERVQGNDRYETSAAIAAAFGQSTNIILASGESGRTPDALAANFLAGVRNAPVLLTRRDTTPEPILAQLRTLRAGGATRITVVGGRVAVADAQIESLRGLGFTVDRVAGDNRYETAAAVAVEGETGEPQEASNIGIIASGVSTIDALAGGPLSFKGRHPLFLVTRDDAPGATIAALRATGVTSVFILGGEAVVGPRVVAELNAAGITVRERLAGANRSETSVAIANRLIADFGFSANTFNLASGVNEGIDALGGAALSGKENRVLLITNTATSAAPVTAFATARATTLTAAGRIFGGEAAVGATLERAVETAGGAAGNFETVAVTPQEAATLQLADDEDAGDAEVTTDNRTYTVTGLNDAVQYRITLVNATSIRGAAGSRTFLSSAIAGATPAAFAVDTGADIADIINVGGTNPTITSTDVAGAPGRADTATVNPVNGSITFTVEGEATGTVVPAVYVNGAAGGTATTGGNSARLETAATAAGAFAAATETFGLGGPTTFVNPAAATQTVADETAIDSVSKATNQFDADGETFTYDANDTFFVNGLPRTLEEFEAALSRQDDFSATYSANAALSSRFNLEDEGPDAPAPVDPNAGADANSNDISVTVPITADVDAVVVQRASVTGGTDERTNGTVGAYATVGTVTPTAAQRTAGSVVFTDENLAVGVYRYRVAYVTDGQTSDFSGTLADDATTPNGANEAATAPAADAGAPVATDTRLTSDRGFAGILDAGDVFVVRTNEALAAPAAGATIRVSDGETPASVADLVCGTNATCTINAAAIPAGTDPNAEAPAGTVLTVTLTGAPTVVSGGAAAGIDLDATIINTIGITDVAGNRLALTGGATELTINVE